MNLSHTFLGEIFVILHRKYLPFFRYLQKSFGEKYALKKSQNSIFTHALSIKIFVAFIRIVFILQFGSILYNPLGAYQHLR